MRGALVGGAEFCLLCTSAQTGPVDTDTREPSPLPGQPPRSHPGQAWLSSNPMALVPPGCSRKPWKSRLMLRSPAACSPERHSRLPAASAPAPRATGTAQHLQVALHTHTPTYSRISAFTLTPGLTYTWTLPIPGYVYTHCSLGIYIPTLGYVFTQRCTHTSIHTHLNTYRHLHILHLHSHLHIIFTSIPHTPAAMNPWAHTLAHPHSLYTHTHMHTHTAARPAAPTGAFCSYNMTAHIRPQGCLSLQEACV